MFSFTNIFDSEILLCVDIFCSVYNTSSCITIKKFMHSETLFVRCSSIIFYSFGYFTRNIIGVFQIMQIVWKTVCYLYKINLKVIAAATDVASPYRKCFTVHKPRCVLKSAYLGLHSCRTTLICEKNQ